MGTLGQRRYVLLISAMVISLLAVMTSTAAATVDSITTPDPGEEELSNPAVIRTTLTAGGDPSMQLDALGNPVVAYTDYVDGEGGLRLLRCDDPACSGSGETITPNRTIGEYNRDTSRFASLRVKLIYICRDTIIN